MTSYEIYWGDLTPEARERLADLYHENLDISPLAIIDLGDDPDDKNEDVKPEPPGLFESLGAALRPKPMYDLEWRRHPDVDGAILIRPRTERAMRALAPFIKSGYPGEYGFKDGDQSFTAFGLTTNPEPSQPD